MKARLRITKLGRPLFAGMYDVTDAESFGKACADAWWQMQQQAMAKESSIGALMEHLDSNVLDQLQGAQISLERA